jgi:hypothetical protein
MNIIFLCFLIPIMGATYVASEKREQKIEKQVEEKKIEMEVKK